MKWKIRTLFLVIIITFLSACTKNKEITESSSLPITPTPLIETSNLKVGNDTYRGFILDNVLKSSYGDIHFNSYFPQINDNEKNILELKKFISKLKNVEKVELLPYHTMAIDKYKKLGIEYKLTGVEAMNKEKCKELEKLLLK